MSLSALNTWTCSVMNTCLDRLGIALIAPANRPRTSPLLAGVILNTGRSHLTWPNAARDVLIWTMCTPARCE